MADYRTFSMKDERVHVFRHESPGKWKHYSRPRWEKNAMEREEDHRQWTISEVQAWIAAEGPPVNPITDKELDWIQSGLAKSHKGESATEPTADPGRFRPDTALTFQCDACKREFPIDVRKKYSWGTVSLCPPCFADRSGGGYIDRGI